MSRGAVAGRRPARSRARLLLAGAGTLAAILAGCGADQATPTPSPAATSQGRVYGPARDFGDACRLLTTAEVQAALGAGAVTAGSRSDPLQGSYCTYSPAAGGASVPLLTVQVIAYQLPVDARGTVDQLGGPPLSGVGDDARLAKPGGLGSAVYVARGSTYAVLTSLHKAVTQQELVKLATTLTGRLS